MGVKFGWYYKMAYLCTALKQNAEIALLPLGAPTYPVDITSSFFTITAP